jgi:hypothetical protein
VRGRAVSPGCELILFLKLEKRYILSAVELRMGTCVGSDAHSTEVRARPNAVAPGYQQIAQSRSTFIGRYVVSNKVELLITQAVDFVNGVSRLRVVP